jgi:exodeoxyribonuclease VII small subunit
VDQDSPQSFEEALAQLEEVVRALEDGQIGLEESLSRYERGVGLIKRCQAQLRHAEQRIQLLTGVDENGQPSLQVFQPCAATAAREENNATIRKDFFDSE